MNQTISGASVADIGVRGPAAGIGIQECWMDMDGLRMRYLRAGSGPPLVLVHGLLGYSFSWRYTMPALAAHATVFAPDMPGAGFSERSASLDCGMAAAARRLSRFVEKLGLSSFDLLGTSYGGAVAMMAAASSLAAGPRVRRLVLVAPVNPYSGQGRWLARVVGSRTGSALFRRTLLRTRFWHRYAHQRLYGSRDRIPPESLAGYTAPLQIPGSFEHELGIVRTWDRDLTELELILPRLMNVPTLLLWGGVDRAVYAASAAALSRHFRNSQLQIFPGVGHLPYEECPEEFNRALITFLTP